MSGSGQTVLSSTSHQQHSGIVAPGLMGNPLSPPPMPPVLGASVGIGPQQYTANQHIGYQVCLVSRICGYIFTFYFCDLSSIRSGITSIFSLEIFKPYIKYFYHSFSTFLVPLGFSWPNQKWDFKYITPKLWSPLSECFK